PGIVHLGFTGGAASDLTADAIGAAKPAGGGGDRLAADSVPDVLPERRMDPEQGNAGAPRSRGRRQVRRRLGAEHPGQGGQVRGGDDCDPRVDAPAVMRLDTLGAPLADGDARDGRVDQAVPAVIRDERGQSGWQGPGSPDRRRPAELEPPAGDADGEGTGAPAGRRLEGGEAHPQHYAARALGLELLVNYIPGGRPAERVVRDPAGVGA